jgi:hypothetical protein
LRARGGLARDAIGAGALGAQPVTERTTRTSVTFLLPFSLPGLDGIQPAGTYRVETIEVSLDNLSFPAYRRAFTTVELPAVEAAASKRQVVTVDPLELEAALVRDGASRPDPDRQQDFTTPRSNEVNKSEISRRRSYSSWGVSIVLGAVIALIIGVWLYSGKEDIEPTTGHNALPSALAPGK